MAQLLYHYTSATALHSILRDQVMRATDVRFMNDSAELSFGVPHLLSALDAGRGEVDTEWRQLDDSDRAAKWSGFKRLRGLVAGVAILASPTYVCCFSTKPDVLSQWRAYAPRGGYSIGFDEAVLRQMNSRFLVGDEGWPVASEVAAFGGFSGTVEEVVYGEIASQALAKTSAGHLLEMVGPPEASRNLMLENRAIHYLARMKNGAFVEEAEKRLILQQEHEAPIGWPQLAFQVSDQLLKPYLSLKFARAAAIKDIVVGPGPDAERRLASVRELIKLCRLDFDPRTSSATLI